MTEPTPRTPGDSKYGRLGVSASKEDVHAAIADEPPGLFPGAFCRIGEDILAGDSNWCCVAHADDAGTKVLVAYLHYRELADARIFRRVAQDALVMNLDDLLCVGAVDRFLLSNTINRNSFHVGGDAIREIIAGYGSVCRKLKDFGIEIVSTGGETADMVDCVRTVTVGATLTTRLPINQVIDNDRIESGDAIVGLSSTGQATYEDVPNSSIGDNGLTLARHSLLSRVYADKYPETLAPEIDPSHTYRGPFLLSDSPAGLGMTVGDALSSPTRTYAPVIKKILQSLPGKIHGIVHNTGGGQTKCRRFGKSIHFRKDNLFAVPPIFRLIAEHGSVSWKEMFQTFNMGHRMELYVSPRDAETVIRISNEFGIEAKIVGRCEQASASAVTLSTEFGEFHYGT